ncbi:MAG TPA: hypothetical protein VK759_03925 [Rhizomicrobium sp.]|jgi:hypothetical protein|nr:hypothetical protein [Rhizomicrobium sp.]
MTTATDSSPAPETAVSIIKRVGAVVLVLGLIDVGIIVYCIVHGVGYRSSFNIFAVAAGIFLLRGSLRAASIVRVFALFMLCGFLWIPFLLVSLMPWDLVVTTLRVCPERIASNGAQWALFVFLLLWIIQELDRESVRTAMAEAGVKQHGFRRPTIAATVIVAIIGVGATMMLHGETAKHATVLAQEKTGPGYHIFVHALSYRKDGHGAYAAADVYAWNDKGIWDFPVRWQTK